MAQLPPKRALQFLRWFCREDFLDEVEGDLLEIFELQSKENLKKANRSFWWQVIRHFRLDYLKPFAKAQSIIHRAMLLSHLKVAWRQLIRYKLHSTINIASLAIGFATFSLIFIWIQHELSYETFHTKANRIYSISSQVRTDTESFQQAVTSPPLGPNLQVEFPEIEKTVRLDFNDAIVKQKSITYTEDGLVFTDPAFFEVFDFQLLKGNPATALSKPYQIVLSERMAERYFGSENPIGKTIRLYLYDPGQEGADFLVTGIIENCPLNTQIQYEALGSFKTIEKAQPTSISNEGWFWNGYYTYLLVKEGTDKAFLESKFPAFTQKYLGDGMDSYNMYYNFKLNPLSSLYFNTSMRYQLATGSKQNLQILGLIGGFILLLAIINYVNLTTAVAANKELFNGIRKTLGANRINLILQHLTESFLIAFLALLISLILIEMVKPIFYLVSNKQGIPFYTFSTIKVLLGVTLLTGCIAGLYPALVFSNANPIKNLKAKSGNRKGILFRKLLVTFQFIITCFLVFGVWVINQQFNFIKERDLGYQSENILNIKVNGDREVIDGFLAFKETLLKESTIESVAGSRTLLAGGLGNAMISTTNGEGKKVNASLFRIRMDEDFLTTYKIPLIAGRDLTFSDSNAFILNEAAIKTFGWVNPEEAIGIPVEQDGESGIVVGVVKNFHYNSLEHAIEPVCMFSNRGRISKISIRYQGNTVEALSRIEKSWELHFPNSYFDFSFFDDSVEKQYNGLKHFTTLFQGFSILCIIIALMGLFGLVTYTTSQRQKEIGIRKVHGATVSSIVWLINAELVVLVTIAFIIALPIGWYAMGQWLNNFAYKVEIHFGWVIITGFVIVLLAIISGIFQSIKTALINPIKSLKDK